MDLVGPSESTSMPTEHSARPRAGKIAAAVEYSGLSRSRLYQIAPRYPGLLRKNGSATIVDFAVLERVIDELPSAGLKAAV